jgi:hypothetical protein
MSDLRSYYPIYPIKQTAGRNPPTKIVDNVRIVGEPVIGGIIALDEPVDEQSTQVKLPSPGGTPGKETERTNHSSHIEWDSYREGSWWAGDSSSSADSGSETSANQSSVSLFNI